MFIHLCNFREYFPHPVLFFYISFKNIKQANNNKKRWAINTPKLCSISQACTCEHKVLRNRASELMQTFSEVPSFQLHICINMDENQAVERNFWRMYTCRFLRVWWLLCLASLDVTVYFTAGLSLFLAIFLFPTPSPILTKCSLTNTLTAEKRPLCFT